jgi:hypothetical protein
MYLPNVDNTDHGAKNRDGISVNNESPWKLKLNTNGEKMSLSELDRAEGLLIRTAEVPGSNLGWDLGFRSIPSLRLSR